MSYVSVKEARRDAEARSGADMEGIRLGLRMKREREDAKMAPAEELATTTFGPLDKYVAANDNVPGQMIPRCDDPQGPLKFVPCDESGAWAGFEVTDRNVGKGLPSTILRLPMPPVQPARQEERKGDWLQTFSGRQFWPMDPRADEVHIEDIAHALSLQCRYAGHCIQFYSVAEHSVHVSEWLQRNYGPMAALYGLLHDASEAYLVDIPRPVKPHLVGYRDAEAKVQDAVHERFGLGRGIPAAVKEADDRIIGDELANLRPMEWHARYDDPLGVKLALWRPGVAEDVFLATFVRLQRALGRVV